MRWVLIAFAVIWAIIALTTVLAVKARRRQPPQSSYRCNGAETDRFDRAHRQLAHYRASGALPRWDP